MNAMELPRGFRKFSVKERVAALDGLVGTSELENMPVRFSDDALHLADIMIESAIGYMPVPLGIASGFLIDGTTYNVPLATEEPSVVAACGFAGSLVARYGGFKTWASTPVMTAQVFLSGVTEDGANRLRTEHAELDSAVQDVLAPMSERGGGLQELEVIALDEPGIVCVELHIDVRDAMGANILNSAAEKAAPVAARISGGEVLMSILTNAAERRMAGAEFRMPVSRLGRGKRDGGEIAERICLATRVSYENRSRAVTHNKGIMNGISALALATGNDTRAIEAAVHSYASRGNGYRGVSEFTVENDALVGKLALPLAFATVGGATTFHPAAQFSLRLLGSPGGTQLSRIAAAVGLAQNLAAVSALVGEGIQQGHMKLHASRIAWSVGARGAEVPAVVERMTEDGRFSVETARRVLNAYRNTGAGGERS